MPQKLRGKLDLLFFAGLKLNAAAWLRAAAILYNFSRYYGLLIICVANPVAEFVCLSDILAILLSFTFNIALMVKSWSIDQIMDLSRYFGE